MIKRILQKYDTNNYVPGEKRTSNTETLHKRRQTISEKHSIADDLIHEAEKLHLTQDDITHIHYLVDKFKDFNTLHRKAKNETIILAFIWYTYKIRNPKRRLNEYAITKKYGLTDPVFELICCRMLQVSLAETPIVPRQSLKYDNDILYKTGVRK